MPGIWNVNNGYNANTRKISSKMTFEVGEKFTGRIVDKGDGKDVTIKLADGWQFIAEVDGKVNLDDIKLVKFQVEGFENGKLKLKLVSGGSSKDSIEDGDENYQEIVEKEGLSKEDIELLKNMVKHNFSLSKENINQIKTLLQFSEKVNSDPDELNAFIEKYIASKGIDIDSEQGKAMKDILTKFISEFKNMDVDDILTFIENNIDFTKENIESFNKLFKSDSSIEKVLISIKDKLSSEADLQFDSKQINMNDINKQEVVNEKADSNIFNKATFSKVYAENDPHNNKINVLDVLKTLAGDNATENGNGKINNETVLNKTVLEKLNNKEIFNEIKEVVGEKTSGENIQKTQASSLIESTNKAKVEDIFSKVEGKDIRLSDQEFKEITKIVQDTSKDLKEQIDFKVIEQSDSAKALLSDDDNKVNQNLFNVDKKIQTDKVFFNNETKTLSKSQEAINDIKNEIKVKIDNVKDIVKELLTHTTLNDSVTDKVTNLIKENINDIRVFNSVSNEYYCLNFDISSQMEKYPCKLIIKDNRKEGKKIDKTNTKMVLSINTVNLGEIDGYLTMKDNKMDVHLKCDNKYTIVLDNHKKELADGLSTLGLYVSVKVDSKEEKVNIVNVRKFFNDITISAIDTRV